MKYCQLVIDVQKGIFGLKQPVYDAKAVTMNIKTAVSHARENGVNVVFVQHENGSFLKKGTEAYQIIDEITVSKTDTVITKKRPSAFDGTGLDDVLKKEGVTHVVILGLISNGCVRHSCLAALEHGYHVILLGNAHSTFYSNGKTIVEKTNREMEEAGAVVRCVEDLPQLFG